MTGDDSCMRDIPLFIDLQSYNYNAVHSRIGRLYEPNCSPLYQTCIDELGVSYIASRVFLLNASPVCFANSELQPQFDISRLTVLLRRLEGRCHQLFLNRFSYGLDLIIRPGRSARPRRTTMDHDIFYFAGLIDRQRNTENAIYTGSNGFIRELEDGLRQNSGCPILPVYRLPADDTG